MTRFMQMRTQSRKTHDVGTEMIKIEVILNRLGATSVREKGTSPGTAQLGRHAKIREVSETRRRKSLKIGGLAARETVTRKRLESRRKTTEEGGVWTVTPRPQPWKNLSKVFRLL
jgi:hypothetical protein